MLPLMAIGAGAQVATGLISGISGIFQKAKARRLAKENVRPVYTIPNEIKQNQFLAQQQAKQGIPAAQMQQGLQSIGRNANAALSASQDRRGGLASIGAITQASNDATLNLSVADASQRVNNIRNLMQQNNVMAQYQDKAFGWNKQAKFEENAAAVRALEGAGNANINTGLNSIIGAGASLAYNSEGGGMSDPSAPPVPPGMLQRYYQFRRRGY